MVVASSGHRTSSASSASATAAKTTTSSSSAQQQQQQQQLLLLDVFLDDPKKSTRGKLKNVESASSIAVADFDGGNGGNGSCGALPPSSASSASSSGCDNCGYVHRFERSDGRSSTADSPPPSSADRSSSNRSVSPPPPLAEETYLYLPLPSSSPSRRSSSSSSGGRQQGRQERAESARLRLRLPTTRNGTSSPPPERYGEEHRHDVLPCPLPPPLLESRDDLLFRGNGNGAGVRLFGGGHATTTTTTTTKEEERFVYASQQEIAHATPDQCEWLVTDRATTCHVLAARSYRRDDDAPSSSSSSGPPPPLSSLAHLDAADRGYERCLSDMVRRHVEHHGRRPPYHNDEGVCSSDAAPGVVAAVLPNIELEFHVVGGFDDCEGGGDGSSRELSNWLLLLLARLAARYSDSGVRATLKTCVVGRWNTAPNGGGPIGRGLAIDTRTGRVQLARVRPEAVQPCPALRSARVFADSGDDLADDENDEIDAPGRRRRRRLACVHDERSDQLVLVEPFELRRDEESDANARILLSLPDSLLLKYTSTSPEFEDGDFCDSMRACLNLLLLSPHRPGVSSPPPLFPENKPMAFRRVGRTNEWRPCADWR